MKTLPDGTEIATSDALKASYGFDFDPNGEYLVGNTPGGLRGAHKTVACYKYFDLANTKEIEITARGNGEIAISCRESAPEKIIVSGNRWKPYQAEITCSQSKSVLTFIIEKGTVDILNFTLIEKN